jgi:tetratricopeptide (TPR) repeat protein
MQKLPSRLRSLVEMGQRSADATHCRRVKTRFGRVLASLSLVALLGVVAVPATAVDPQTCFEETGEAAIAACTRLIESGKFDGNTLAVIYFDRGVTLYNIREYDRAIQDYDQALELNPQFAQAVFSRGNALGEKGQFDRAIQDYGQAIKLNPNYAIAFNNLGYVWDEMHDFDRAIEDYDRAIDLNPQYAQAFNNRGMAYANKVDWDRAIRDYDRAIELDPGYTAAFYNRGVAKLKSGKIRDGNADIATAKAINPDIGR